MTRRRGALLAAALAVTASANLQGQAIELGAPDAVFEESYSFVQSVRELADGRVMWADPLGQALVRADLDAGTADTLGAVGQGPEEYRQPDAVWPLPGDSTLLVDLGNGRLTAIASDGTFGETWPVGMGEPGPGMVIALPRAVDGRGLLYVTGRPGPSPTGALADSGAVLRVDRASGSADTVALFKFPRRTVDRSGGANQQRMSISMVPLSPADAWGVSPDGRLAVARSGDYHLEWIGPDGSVTAGDPVPFEAVRIGQAEKEEWDRDRARSGGGLSIGMSVVNGVASMSLSRGGSGSDDDLDQYDWPDRKPPFYDGTVLVDGQGRAWVRRHRDAGEAPLYDVFGGQGQHLGSVVLGADRRIVGFGTGTLYVVRMDEFDLNTVERYTLPEL